MIVNVSHLRKSVGGVLPFSRKVVVVCLFHNAGSRSYLATTALQRYNPTGIKHSNAVSNGMKIFNRLNDTAMF